MTSVDDRAVQAHIAIDDLFTAVGLARPEIEEVARDGLVNAEADFGFVVDTLHIEHLPSLAQRAAEAAELRELIAQLPLTHVGGALDLSYKDRLQVLDDLAQSELAGERWAVYRVSRAPESSYSMIAVEPVAAVAIVKLMQTIVYDRARAFVEASVEYARQASQQPAMEPT